MIRVLIAEDSPAAAQWLARLLEQDPEVRVVGIAKNGLEVLAFAERDRPDVIAMDIHMPALDGIEATRRLMQTQPVPIVIVSASWKPNDVEVTFRAMEAGAVAMVEKPPGPGHPLAASLGGEFVTTVKTMAGVRVVRRWGARGAAERPGDVAGNIPLPVQHRNIQVVAVGASTGGPPVLRTLLEGLSKDFPAPVLIVQHIAAGFLQGLAEWLSESTGVSVQIAAHGVKPREGCAYLAPDGRHMGVDGEGRIVVANGPPENGLKPSVAQLFRSVADVFKTHAAGVLLTGMGRDGAAELKLLRERGALTFAQDELTSVIHGMPGEAIRLGGAMYVLPPVQIAHMLVKLAKTHPA